MTCVTATEATFQPDLGCGIPRRLYAVNRGAGSISVIDQASGRERARVPVQSAPGDLAVDPTTNTLYVSNAGTSTISVVADRLDGEPAHLPDDAGHRLVGEPLPEFELRDVAGDIRSSREWSEKKSSTSSRAGEDRATRRRPCSKRCVAVPAGLVRISS